MRRQRGQARPWWRCRTGARWCLAAWTRRGATATTRTCWTCAASTGSAWPASRAARRPSRAPTTRAQAPPQGLCSSMSAYGVAWPALRVTRRPHRVPTTQAQALPQGFLRLQGMSSTRRADHCVPSISRLARLVLPGGCMQAVLQPCVQAAASQGCLGFQLRLT